MDRRGDDQPPPPITHNYLHDGSEKSNISREDCLGKRLRSRNEVKLEDTHPHLTPLQKNTHIFQLPVLNTSQFLTCLHVQALKVCWQTQNNMISHFSGDLAALRCSCEPFAWLFLFVHCSQSHKSVAFSHKLISPAPNRGLFFVAASLS